MLRLAWASLRPQQTSAAAPFAGHSRSRNLSGGSVEAEGSLASCCDPCRWSVEVSRRFQLRRLQAVRRVCVVLGGVLLHAAALAQEPLGPELLPPPSLLGRDAAWGAAETLESTPTETVPALNDAAAAAPVGVDLAEGLEIGPTPHWYEPAYWFGPLPWDAGLEFGLNGSEGNNQVMSMRAGGHLRRKTPVWKFDSSIAYNKNVANGLETQSNGKVDVRVDRVLDGSRWTLFFLENLIYDEFQAFDVQLSLNSGFGYQLIDTPNCDLMTRFGAGATREVGGVNNDWVPQALLGVDYTQQISEMQRLRAKLDYFPEWGDLGDYRVIADAGWEIALDRPRNVSLKLSVTNRYDSTPDGVDPNNLDYSALIIWGL